LLAQWAIIALKMTKDIISKLKTHLEHRVETECGALYLLAEIRKLLERDDPKHQSFALWMYCHWALHVDLSGLDTTKQFLLPIDALVFNKISGFGGDPFYNPLTEDLLFRELIFLDTFRDQLKAFLMQYGLPTEICDNEDSWFSFVEAYAGIIEDGSLSISSDNTPLKAIKKVVFCKGGVPIAADSIFSFVIQWDIVLIDDRIFRMGFEAKPGRRALSFGGQLIPAPARAATPPLQDA